MSTDRLTAQMVRNSAEFPFHDRLHAGPNPPAALLDEFKLKGLSFNDDDDLFSQVERDMNAAASHREDQFRARQRQELPGIAQQARELKARYLGEGKSPQEAEDLVVKYFKDHGIID